MAAPSIAKDYWRLPENATIKEVLYAVRSDESTHRFVNHSLGNLEANDLNPFAIREPNMHVKGKTIEYVYLSPDDSVLMPSILTVFGKVHSRKSSQVCE
jgi:hypothetical protein